MNSDLTVGIICNIGTIFYHNSILYNCRVVCLNKKILYIRPKMHLACDGNYREMRWFTGWSKKGIVEKHLLSNILQKITKQRYIPFGDCYIETKETKIGDEMCEELWVPNSPHILYGLCGVEIFINGSGSHHELRKLNTRIDLIQSAVNKTGGCYIYSNLIGCDGGRLNFDGSSLICLNGKIIKQSKQFSLKQVDVITAIIDLQQIRTYRMSINSRNQQATNLKGLSYYVDDGNVTSDSKLPKAIYVDFSIAMKEIFVKVNKPIKVHYHSFEEEIALGPAQWLWDYLRRSGANGFFLPLSGGADSSSTATIVGSMCNMVIKEIVENNNETVIKDIMRILKLNKEKQIPKTAKLLCNKILHTCYMGTKHSSKKTNNYASNLANELGSYHHIINIDTMVDATLWVFKTVLSTIKKCNIEKVKLPKYYQNGNGSPTEDRALQNIQARLRMVFSYLMAQLLPWAIGKKGWFLVLGSSNVDEGLRGYLTKYDCSSADLKPIGGICKNDLKSFLKWSSIHLGYKELKSIEKAPPSAELKPAIKGEIQKDEDEMGMTYDELTIFGKLRKIQRCGPVSMFKELVQQWAKGYATYSTKDKTLITINEVAVKVKRFFRFYAMNRHKMATLTPSVHMENYSPEDNRHDLRQIFYNVNWPYQFKKIDELVQKSKN